MRRGIIAALVTVLSCAAAGCGLGRTSNENFRAAVRVADYDARMLVDDVALLLLTERPQRTSRLMIK